MASIRKRPIVLRGDNDVNVKNLEENFKHVEGALSQLDNRRIEQLTALDDSASLSDVITALNSLFAALNGSDLTNE